MCSLIFFIFIKTVFYEFFFILIQAKDVQAQFKTSIEEVTPIIKQLDKSVQVGVDDHQRRKKMYLYYLYFSLISSLIRLSVRPFILSTINGVIIYFFIYYSPKIKCVKSSIDIIN